MKISEQEPAVLVCSRCGEPATCEVTAKKWDRSSYTYERQLFCSDCYLCVMVWDDLGCPSNYRKVGGIGETI